MAQKTVVERFETEPHSVAVLAFDGVVLGDLAVPCEVLGRVPSGAGGDAYSVRVCSTASEVRTRHMKLCTPYRLASVRTAATVIVPGVEDLDVPIPAAVLRCLQRAHQRGARVLSICTGAFVLAAAGLLDGRRATTHWAAAGVLASRFPRIEVDPRVLYVDGGAIMTSAGAAAGLDLCLHLVRSDHGAEVAAAVARASVMPLERAGGQAQYIAEPRAPQDVASLGPVLDWLESNLDAPLDLPAIARQWGMSTRTLNRRFRDQTGLTPAHWLAHARVRRAQRLLETTELSVEQLAEQVGFGSSTVLRTHFCRVVGTTPTAYRRAFTAKA